MVTLYIYIYKFWAWVPIWHHKGNLVHINMNSPTLDLSYAYKKDEILYASEYLYSNRYNIDDMSGSSTQSHSVPTPGNTDSVTSTKRSMSNTSSTTHSPTTGFSPRSQERLKRTNVTFADEPMTRYEWIVNSISFIVSYYIPIKWYGIDFIIIQTDVRWLCCSSCCINLNLNCAGSPLLIHSQIFMRLSVHVSYWQTCWIIMRCDIVCRLNFGAEMDSACSVLLEHIESGSSEKSSKVVNNNITRAYILYIQLLHASVVHV